MLESRCKNGRNYGAYSMALLPENMGHNIVDTTWDLAVQRISGRGEKKERTGISKAVPGDDTVSVSCA